MSDLNSTPSANRIHISFFGLRNAGKSSVVNAVTGQQLSIVSDVRGTTTDPVKKAMELLPLGPVVIYDTPGIDDEGELGALRVKKTAEVLAHSDVAVLVADSTAGLGEADRELVAEFEKRSIPYIIALNKCDLLAVRGETAGNTVYTSAVTGEGINELKEKLAALGKSGQTEKHILADLVTAGDTVVLVIPIDASAPKGRIILPQQQVLRELLEIGCNAVCTQHTSLKGALEALSVKPRLVITDSQVFGFVSRAVPEDIMLTSFSILFARYKGSLEKLVRGAKKLSELDDNDICLISEGCTHHRQCADIGTVQIPNLIKKYTGKNPSFEFTSGGEYPDDMSKYALNIHCGGCMLNEREMKSRIKRSEEAAVPVVNYGIALAQMNGILKRSLEPFPEAAKLLK
ncbi:MAG: [Clostridia bacterium]|nr:[FeFe] hydrogenase H-cluster maturation GTPase HydF [Clostridia bacterium]